MEKLDGLKAVLNAIAMGLGNQRPTSSGILLNEKQVSVLNVALMHLFINPFIDFDEAVELVMMIEDAGFIVEPKIFELLYEAMEDAGL